MGAAKYRWFHAQGCCQCVGQSCLHYGKGEALCLRCGLSKSKDLDNEQTMALEKKRNRNQGRRRHSGKRAKKQRNRRKEQEF